VTIEKAESKSFDIIIVLPKIKQTEVPALSTSITQNDYDSAEISGSISTFFKRFHVASLLKASNIRKVRFAPPSGHWCVCWRTLGGVNEQRFNQSLSRSIMTM